MTVLKLRSSLAKVEPAAIALLDLVFPPTCVACQQAGSPLCPRCAQLAEPVGDRICLCCGRRQPEQIARCATCQGQEGPLNLVRAATIHSGVIRQAAHHLKYGGVTTLAPLLARYLVAAFLLHPWPAFYGRIDGVTPVPLHAQRLQERSYNQAELLAKAFCQQVHLPMQPQWLERQRLTRSQVGLHAHERNLNVADAFRAHPALYGKRILLIDDVYTTGATLTACAQAARAAGARAVYALTLAMAERIDDTMAARDGFATLVM
jgi:ComF family protein